MNYKKMLTDEIIYYTKKGYIPKLNIYAMSIIEIEKIVDYCFTIEYNLEYDNFVQNTNLGYFAKLDEIKKLIEKRSMK